MVDEYKINPNPSGWNVYRKQNRVKRYDPGWGRMDHNLCVFYKHPTALPSFSFIPFGIYSIIIPIFSTHQFTDTVKHHGQNQISN